MRRAWAFLLLLFAPPCLSATMLVFPFEGRPDWASAFADAYKDALRVVGDFEVVDFSLESPIIRRAVAQKGLKPEEIAEAMAIPEKRPQAARRLGFDAATWGEVREEGVVVFVAEAATGKVHKFEFPVLGDIEPFLERLATRAARRVKDALPSLLSEEEKRRKAEELLRQGEVVFRGGDPLGATRFFHDALALNPKLMRAHFLLSEAYEKAGKLADALAAARGAAEVDPRNPRAHLRVAELAIKLGKWDEAEKAFNRALSLKPKDPQILQAYADYLLKRNRPAEAAKVLRKVCALKPKEKEPRRLLAEALVKAKREMEAVEVWRELARLYPKESEPKVKAAVLLSKVGRHAEALDELAKTGEGKILISAEDYSALLSAFDKELTEIMNKARSAIIGLQRGQVVREECYEVLTEVMARAERLRLLSRKLEAPAPFAEARAHRRLAYETLGQALLHFLAYVDTNDPVMYYRGTVEWVEVINEVKRAREMEEERK